MPTLSDLPDGPLSLCLAELTPNLHQLQSLSQVCATWRRVLRECTVSLRAAELVQWEPMPYRPCPLTDAGLGRLLRRRYGALQRVELSCCDRLTNAAALTIATTFASTPTTAVPAAAREVADCVNDERGGGGGGGGCGNGGDGDDNGSSTGDGNVVDDSKGDDADSDNGSGRSAAGGADGYGGDDSKVDNVNGRSNDADTGGSGLREGADVNTSDGTGNSLTAAAPVSPPPSQSPSQSP